jgi:hypothetical protein
LFLSRFSGIYYWVISLRVVILMLPLEAIGLKECVVV